MIHLVSLNPALDLVFRVERNAKGKIGTIDHSNLEAGGKALNLSRFLTRLGVPTTTWLGTGGGEDPTHLLYRALLKKEGLHARFLSRKAPIRFNLVLEKDGKAEKFNHPGFELDLVSFGQLFRSVGKKDLLVLTGRLPQGMNPALYGSWVQAFGHKDVRVAVDTSGKPLEWALKTAPWFFKVNLFELSEALKINVTSLAQVPRLLKSRFLLHGLIHGAITDGPKGAIVWENSLVYSVRPPDVRSKKLVVGAGDAFLAGYLAAWKQGKDMKERARWACAAGSVVASTGIMGFKPKEMIRLVKRVKVERAKG